MAARGGGRYIDAAGARVFLQEWGAGPTVVCLHGLGGGGYFFSALGPLLASRYRTVALDLPGSGVSPAPPVLSLDSLAEVVVAVARTAASSPLCLLGHSMGTIIALEAIRRAPGLAAGLLTVGGLPEALPEARARIISRVAEIRDSGITGLGSRVAAANVSVRTSSERPEVTGLVARLFELQPSQGYVATAEALTGWTARPLPRLDEVRCLAVTGDEDRYAPPEAVRAFARTLPATTVVQVMEGCGHLPFLEQPAAFAEIVGRFMAVTCGQAPR